MAFSWSTVRARIHPALIRMKEKARDHCQHRFSKGNVIVKLGRYFTRIFSALVWVAVLWSFLTECALPRQYVEYLRSRTPEPCTSPNSTFQIPSMERDRISSYLNQNWTDSLSEFTSYQVVAVSKADRNGSYEVLLLRQDADCLNKFAFKGYTLLLNISAYENISGNEPGINIDASTEDSVSATVNVQQLLNPQETSSDLLTFPVGHFFSFFLLLVVSSVFGVIAKWVFLPPLVGMIIAGLILRNVPGIDFARDISDSWSSAGRNIALVLVLIRGGLSMDIRQLKRLKVAVLLLAFLPCTLEGAIDGMVGTLWLRLPWQFGFTLGYVIAAISPAVVVPTTLDLQEEGYGEENGIPTLIVAAASMDVVISISLFGVFLGLAFSEGNLILDIFRAPIQIVVGLLFGGIFGLLLWVFPTKHFKPASKTRNRFFLLFGLGLFALFGSKHAVLDGSDLSGSGALAVLVLAFMAAQGWHKEEKKEVARAFYMVWQFFEPLLFGLIGAAVDIQFISPSLVGQGIGLILIGLVLRLSVSFTVVLGNHFRWAEMVFIAIAWLPKATVQAAIGSLALDAARRKDDADPEIIDIGRKILTVAVIAIILTAPLGALATSLLGPVLLKKADKEEEEDEDVEKQKSVADDNANVLDTSMGAAGGTNGVDREIIAMDVVIIEELKAEPKTYNTISPSTSS